jgi:hypothetical protein
VLWALIWIVLALAAAAVFFLVGRDLWRKAVALVHELGAAADRLAEASDRIERLTERASERPTDVRSQSRRPPQQR